MYLADSDKFLFLINAAKHEAILFVADCIRANGTLLRFTYLYEFENDFTIM